MKITFLIEYRLYQRIVGQIYRRSPSGEHLWDFPEVSRVSMISTIIMLEESI